MTYTAYATAEVTTAYFIEALDASDQVIGYTEPQTTGFTCTFTVNRTNQIVLNEIFYDPIGDDSGTNPAGEWVELYNNGTTSVDLNGWKIRDAVGNIVTISSANSDNDLNPYTGETVIYSSNWLVVYMQTPAMLDNTGDTVTLLTPTNEPRDSHTYAGGKAEGTTEARNVDGTGFWVDPLPTPVRLNVLTSNDLNPSIRHWDIDSNHMLLGLHA
ncbi:MAG: hypothetical protein UW75_C0064G0005 [Parcubacteria group bacterium GW2011_GWF2_44_8]|nr:MAG: hypothetical protein UW75_C0064G0005 [Parcubacteria group bacterium GW2011_GWF2_44_8]